MADNVQTAKRPGSDAEFVVVDQEETSESEMIEITDKEGIATATGDIAVDVDEVHDNEDTDGMECKEVDGGADGGTAEGEPKAGKNVDAKIQALVSQALESKLTGFQTQMQQMMAVLQNVTDVTGTEGEEDGMECHVGEEEQGDVKIVTVEEGPDEVKDETPGVPEPSSSQLTDPGCEEEDESGRSALEREKVQEWESVLAKVCSILDIDAIPVEAPRKLPPFRGGAAGRKGKIPVKSSIQLPPNDILKECWKEENTKMKRSTPITRMERMKYMWPKADQDTLGFYPEADKDVIDYLHELHRVRRPLDPQMSKIHILVRMSDQTLRFQQKAISYASYFLEALQKGIKSEEEVDRESFSEILQKLGECLTDVCDMSVRASSRSVNARRRMYLDRMQLTHPEAYLDFLSLPSGMKMFGGQMKTILKKHSLPVRPGDGTGPGEFDNTAPGDKRSGGPAKYAKGGGDGKAKQGGQKDGSGMRKAGGPQKQGGGGLMQGGGGSMQGGVRPMQGGPRQGGGVPRQARGGKRQNGSARQVGAKQSGDGLAGGAGNTGGGQSRGGGGNTGRGQSRGSRGNVVGGGQNRRFKRRAPDGDNQSPNFKRQRGSNNQSAGRNMQQPRQSFLPDYDTLASDFYPPARGAGFSSDSLAGQSLGGFGGGYVSPYSGGRNRPNSNMGQDKSYNRDDMGLDSHLNTLYPTPQLGGRSQLGGGGSYNSGDASSYLGYMSFTDSGSSLGPGSSGNHGNSSQLYSYNSGNNDY